MCFSEKMEAARDFLSNGLPRRMFRRRATRVTIDAPRWVIEAMYAMMVFRDTDVADKFELYIANLSTAEYWMLTPRWRTARFPPVTFGHDAQLARIVQVVTEEIAEFKVASVAVYYRDMRFSDPMVLPQALVAVRTSVVDLLNEKLRWPRELVPHKLHRLYQSRFQCADADPRWFEWQLPELMFQLGGLAGDVATHNRCKQCGKKLDHPRLCGRCRAVQYCGTECQKAHWRAGHKHACAADPEQRVCNDVDHLLN